MEIGSKIKNLRRQNGLTQEELGDRCELSKGFISLLESDKTSPSMSTLEDILNALIGIAEARYEESFGSAKKIGTIPENIDGFIHETMKRVRFTMTEIVMTQRTG